MPRPTAVAVVETKKAVVLTLGSVASSLPKPVALNAGSVAAAIMNYETESLRAEGNAVRAVINDEETLGRGADVVKSITVQLTNLDETRLEQTRLYDSAKKTVMDLFGGPKKRFEESKTVLLGKMDVWQRAETVRRKKEADEAIAKAKEEADAQAEALLAAGDEQGAEQVLEEAATVVIAPAKVVATGFYGGTAGVRKQKTGSVRNRYSFLNALVKRSEPSIKDFVAEMEFSQAGLNRLAALVLSGDINAIPGFDAEEKSAPTVR